MKKTEVTPLESPITKTNWNYSYYKNQGLKAFISLGGIPLQQNSEKTEIELVYYVTAMDGDQEELFQSEHPSLSAALEDLYRRYGHWDFVDGRRQGKDDGGCGNCSAH